MNELDAIEHDLSRNRYNSSQLTIWTKRLQAVKQTAGECVSDNESNREKATKDLETLGAPVKSESPEVTQQRRSLEKSVQNYEKHIADCRLLGLRSDDISGRITTLQQQILAERLLARSPDLIALIKTNWQETGKWLETGRSALIRNLGLNLLDQRGLFELLALSLAAAFGGFWLRRRGITALHEAREAAHAPPASFSGRLSLAASVMFLHYLPHLLVASGWALFAWRLLPDTGPPPLLAMLAFLLPVYFVVRAIIFVFLNPRPPASTLHLLPIHAAKSLARRLNVLVLLVLASYLLFSALVEQTLPGSALALARAIFGAVFVLNLLWIAWILGQVPRFETMRWLRVVIALVFLGSLAAEWSGYRNLSLFMLRAVLGTLMVLGLTLLLRLLLRELCDTLDAGRYAWQRWLHRRMGLGPEQNIPGIGWVRFIVFVLLWGGFVLATLRIWGLTSVGLSQLMDMANQGFTVGSLTIVPTRLLWAVAAFVVLLAIRSWIGRRMERSWLPQTRMDRGAREAMVTITGYAGLAVALLVALGVAGVSFGNLAIIAGALSVGIGFGLQNIVNNFVSGLILLFERPIKTGDWIVVGNTEGYVRRISIRSTQIQTFDRADVIVPNSELISSQVTNWMLYDPRGRVRLPIGVAYGSDTRKVKDILLQLATDHPAVVTDGSSPEPLVLFLGFGDSSLNFELRFFVTNIDLRLTVMSDLNFALDEAFRKQGIEIPFPQRDLHVRNWPGPPGGGEN